MTTDDYTYHRTTYKVYEHFTNKSQERIDVERNKSSIFYEIVIKLFNLYLVMVSTIFTKLLLTNT